MARSNWELHHAFRDLEADFSTDNQQTQSAAEQRLQRYEAAREMALAELDALRSEMGARAEAVARGLILRNAPGSLVDVRVPFDIQLSIASTRSSGRASNMPIMKR